MDKSIVMESMVRSGQRIQAQVHLLLTLAQVLMTPVLIQALMKRKRIKAIMARKVGNMTTSHSEGIREMANDLEKASILDPPHLRTLLQVLMIKENIMEKDLLEGVTRRKTSRKEKERP